MSEQKRNGPAPRNNPLRAAFNLIGNNRGAVSIGGIFVFSLALLAATFVMARMRLLPFMALMLLFGLSWIILLASGVLWISHRRVCADCNQVWHLVKFDDLPRLCPDCRERAIEHHLVAAEADRAFN
jgi:hypothetical protein